MAEKAKTTPAENTAPVTGADIFKAPLAKKDTLWPRKGRPGQTDLSNGTDWQLTVNNTGCYPDRILTDETIVEMSAKHSNLPFHRPLEERAFAQVWDYINNAIKSGDQPAMYRILSDEFQARLDTPEKRELVEMAMQTLYQWLGTIAGSTMINNARALADESRKALRTKVRELRNVMIATKQIPFPTDADLKAEAEEDKLEQERDAADAKAAAEEAKAKENA